MLQVCSEGIFTQNESNPGRQKRNQNHEESLLSSMQQFKVFSSDVLLTSLHNVGTKDLAIDSPGFPLECQRTGKKYLEALVNDRLTIYNEQKTAVPRSNAPTFESLYEIVKNNKDKDKASILKDDRSVLQRLIVVYVADRSVDLQDVLKHELVNVPMSLAEMNGSRRTGTKSVLADILITSTDCPSTNE
ncbi:hypothetical protein Hamer_G009979 [Homarus americanus]|uniref:Uncharacterized protein n=1 Tax=Homarus americanus TaxID=6706 RepID=A0A8J5JQ47_HOMAM|nr:hypothetical protein Hamer_G009979 [Homarus americanus]